MVAWDEIADVTGHHDVASGSISFTRRLGRGAGGKSVNSGHLNEQLSFYI